MSKLSNLFLALAFFSCQNPDSKPDSTINKTQDIVVDPKQNKSIDLPEELNEISGISFLNDSVLVAIQDEEGVLFFVDIKQNRIIKKQVFGEPDDYEDIVIAGDDIYVITSAGVLYEIKNYIAPLPEVREYKTSLTKDNNVEGLAYDAKNNRLLIAPKELGLSDDETIREIYSFDLQKKQFSSKAAFTIRVDEIEAQFKGDALEESSKKFLKALGNRNMNKILKASALTVNEKTGDIYILSSINNFIIVLNSDGKLNRILRFDGPEYKQPEGIAFTPDDRLFISNEGAKSGIGNIVEVIYEK